MNSLVILVVLGLVAVIHSKDDNKDSRSFNYESKDITGGDFVVGRGYIGYKDFSSVVVSKNGQEIFRKTNTTATKSFKFSQFDNIVSVGFERSVVNKQIDQEFSLILQRYAYQQSRNGGHKYSRNVSGAYEWKVTEMDDNDDYYYNTYPTDTFKQHITLEHVELKLSNSEETKFNFTKGRSFTLDCNFYVYNNLTALIIYQNNKEFFRYNVTDNKGVIGQVYAKSDVMLNRGYFTQTQNKITFFISNYDTDLYGEYHATMFYEKPSSVNVYSLNSNLLFFNVK